MAKFTIRNQADALEYLIRCAKCGTEAWYWIDISKSIRCCEPLLGKGPKCNGELTVVQTRKRDERMNELTTRHGRRED